MGIDVLKNDETVVFKQKLCVGLAVDDPAESAVLAHRIRDAVLSGFLHIENENFRHPNLYDSPLSRWNIGFDRATALGGSGRGVKAY